MLYRALTGRDPGQEELDHWRSASHASSSGEIARSLLASSRPVQAPIYVPPGHYYSPITPTVEVDRHIRDVENRGWVDRVAGVRIDRAAIVRLWTNLVPLMPASPFGTQKADGFR